MSKINQYENEEILTLREKNWNQRFVLGKIPKFDAYNDINYLSLGLLKSKLRYEERVKKDEAKTKYNERLFSGYNIKSKSYGKSKFGNNKKNSLKNQRFPSMRIYLNSNKDLKEKKNNKKNSMKNSYNYPYQGTLTAQNVSGSYLFKFNPDYKNKIMNHNYIDYICEEDQEISDEYYLLKELWEKLGVTEKYIINFNFLLNSKYKNRDEFLEIIKGERKQMKQFRIEFMKVLSEINKRESKIKDLKSFIKLYEQALINEKRYFNNGIKDKRMTDVEATNKERIEDDIHECLKSLRLRTINTVNAIKKFKNDYDHLFNNKIDLEIIKEKYGYNEYYLSKLKNDLDFLKDSSLSHLYHFSENGGDPFLLSISDLCGNVNDVNRYRQVRISEEVLSVAKKFMFFLEQEDVYNMTTKRTDNNNIKYKIKNKEIYSQNYINNHTNYKYNKKDLKENLLSENFKGNIEKEKIRLKAQNEYQNLFFNTEDNNNNNHNIHANNILLNKKHNKANNNFHNPEKNIIKEIPYKTLATEQNKYHMKGMTSNQLFRQLDKYGKIKNELFPSTSQDKLKEKIKSNIIKNIEDRMKKVEIDFQIKMEEKFKNEEKKLKEEQIRIKNEKAKIEKLFLEEEKERKLKEEKYLKLEKEIEERKIKEKKINEENEKFDKREKDLFVKEMQKKFLDEVDERFKKDDEKQIQFKKDLISQEEKREKARKEEKEKIRTEEFDKIKRGEFIVDLREKKKTIEKKNKKKKIKKSESSENEEDEEDEEEESDEVDKRNEGNSSNKKDKNNNKLNSDNNDYTSSNINKINKKESSNSNENISEDIEEES